MIYRQNDNRENVDMIDIVQPIVHARNIGSTPQFFFLNLIDDDSMTFEWTVSWNRAHFHCKRVIFRQGTALWMATTDFSDSHNCAP